MQCSATVKRMNCGAFSLLKLYGSKINMHLALLGVCIHDQTNWRWALLIFLFYFFKGGLLNLVSDTNLLLILVGVRIPLPPPAVDRAVPVLSAVSECHFAVSRSQSVGWVRICCMHRCNWQVRSESAWAVQQQSCSWGSPVVLSFISTAPVSFMLFLNCFWTLSW